MHLPPPTKISSTIENNLFSKVKYYPSLLPGMSVTENTDVVRVNSNEPSSTFNIVCNARLNADSAAEHIREVGNHFSARNLPACWWIGPSTNPANLGEILKTEGWIYEGSDLGLAADIRTISIQPQCIENITIENVRDSKAMMDFASVLASFFSESEGKAIQSFYAKVASLGFNDHDPLQNFVAYYDGKPVATSSFYLDHGVAGFYDCLTLPEMRRKGIGLAMMMKRFQIVLELGFPWVTLSSSHDSRSLYQRLGFQKYCEFSTFVKV